MNLDLDRLAQEVRESQPTRLSTVEHLQRRNRRRTQRRFTWAGLAAAPVLMLLVVIAVSVFGTHGGPAQRVTAADSAEARVPASTPTLPSESSPETSPSPYPTTSMFEGGSLGFSLPDVVGQPVRKAREALQQFGLVVTISASTVRGADIGTVLVTDPPSGTSVVRGQTVSVVVQDGPSQTPQEAERDQVVPEIAALPSAVRINQIGTATGAGRTSVQTADGVWIISKPDETALDGKLDGCLLGDTAGVYGRDYVCVSTYTEILLLDEQTDQILRAYPFPDVPPRSLTVGAHALYCVGQGDGGVTDSVLCRIDHDSLDIVVRVFAELGQQVLPKDTWTPDGWTVDERNDLDLFQNLQTDSAGVTITGADGSTLVDPDTLELLDFVVPSRRSGPWSEPPEGAVMFGPFPYWEPAAASVEGNSVTIHFTGGAEYAPGKQCSNAYTAIVDEMADEVVVRMFSWGNPRVVGTNTTCTALGIARELTFDLESPLGDRPVRKG